MFGFRCPVARSRSAQTSSFSSFTKSVRSYNFQPAIHSTSFTSTNNYGASSFRFCSSSSAESMDPDVRQKRVAALYDNLMALSDQLNYEIMDTGKVPYETRLADVRQALQQRIAEAYEGKNYDRPIKYTAYEDDADYPDVFEYSFDWRERYDKNFFRLRKLRMPESHCYFCTMPVAYFDALNVPLLIRFMTRRGAIIPRRHTGTCMKHQRKLAKVIKKATQMGFFSYKEGFMIISPFKLTAGVDEYDPENFIMSDPKNQSELEDVDREDPDSIFMKRYLAEMSRHHNRRLRRKALDMGMEPEDLPDQPFDDDEQLDLDTDQPILKADEVDKL